MEKVLKPRVLNNMSPRFYSRRREIKTNQRDTTSKTNKGCNYSYTLHAIATSYTFWPSWQAENMPKSTQLP